MTWNNRPNRANAVPTAGSQEERIREAVETLQQAVDAADGDTLFLWTGGKEANVIADLLLYAVGEPGEQPVPFGVIDTGNHFDAMYTFREDYAAADGDQGADTVGPLNGLDDLRVRRYEAMLQQVIENPHDPRGYHGAHDGTWRCPDCGEPATRDGSTISCDDCGATTLEDVQRQHMAPEEWDVAASCGALKVQPLKQFITDGGFTRLITGRRGDDPVVQTDARDGVELVEEHEEPAPHTRFNPLASWREPHVWAYIKAESVSYPELYDQGYRHTDAACCTKDADQQADEYAEDGVDAAKAQQRQRLQEMGYV